MCRRAERYPTGIQEEIAATKELNKKESNSYTRLSCSLLLWLKKGARGDNPQGGRKAPEW